MLTLYHLFKLYSKETENIHVFLSIEYGQGTWHVRWRRKTHAGVQRGNQKEIYQLEGLKYDEFIR